MEKEEPAEDLPHVSTFHLALADSNTYYRWRDIGVIQQLSTDEDIACFLLECYDKTKGGVQSAREVCTRCQSSLQLLCVHCDVSVREAVPAVTSGRDRGRVKKKTIQLQKAVTRSHRRKAAQSKNSAVSSKPARPVRGASSQEDSRPFTRGRRSRKKKPGEVRKIAQHKSEKRESIHALPHVEVKVKEEQVEANDFDMGMESAEVERPSVPMETDPDQDSLPQLSQPESDDGSVGRVMTDGRVAKKRGRPRYKRVACAQCGQTMSSNHNLLLHMQSQHPNTELSQSLAELAAKLDADAEKVKARLKRKAELESLTCSTCHMTFDSKTKMSQHWKRQCQYKVCDLCGKSVKALDMHMKRHLHPKRFQCPHCPKSYVFKTYLDTHLLYHNREKPFCCEICGMRYYEKFRLNAHIRTHTGVKPYKCTQCDAAFTRSRGLSDHMRVHTGEKPYACQVCGRQFSSSGNLAAHRRKVHKLQPQVAAPSKQRLLPVAEPQDIPPSSQAETGVGTAGLPQNPIQSSLQDTDSHLRTVQTTADSQPQTVQTVADSQLRTVQPTADSQLRAMPISADVQLRPVSQAAAENERLIGSRASPPNSQLMEQPDLSQDPTQTAQSQSVMLARLALNAALAASARDFPTGTQTLNNQDLTAAHTLASHLATVSKPDHSIAPDRQEFPVTNIAVEARNFSATEIDGQAFTARGVSLDSHDFPAHRSQDRRAVSEEKPMVNAAGFGLKPSLDAAAGMQTTNTTSKPTGQQDLLWYGTQ